ncbi:MAG: hypothetical protein LBS01_04155 [Prevotellaceae bacterium]|nr:hypothetical protein [Prevotellaceae bacterium]
MAILFNSTAKLHKTLPNPKISWCWNVSITYSKKATSHKILSWRKLIRRDMGLPEGLIFA